MNLDLLLGNKMSLVSMSEILIPALDTDVSKAISIGIAKVNVCTELVAAFADTFANEQGEQDFRYNVPGVFSRPRVAAKKLIEEKIRLFSGL